MYTAEQVESHFENLDLSTMDAGGADHFSAADTQSKPLEVLGKVCSIYKKVKPFLELASNLFLIPAKWRNALKSYIALMDQVCP